MQNACESAQKALVHSVRRRSLFRAAASHAAVLPARLLLPKGGRQWKGWGGPCGEQEVGEVRAVCVCVWWWGEWQAGNGEGSVAPPPGTSIQARSSEPANECGKRARRNPTVR